MPATRASSSPATTADGVSGDSPAATHVHHLPADDERQDRQGRPDQYEQGWHRIPASSSWLNLAERWFAELTNRKLRRAAHRSAIGLGTGIRQWLSERNKDPKPFVWPRPLMRSSNH